MISEAEGPFGLPLLMHRRCSRDLWRHSRRPHLKMMNSGLHRVMISSLHKVMIGEEHGVKALFCAPTALRAIRGKDPKGELVASRDLSAFATLFQRG